MSSPTHLDRDNPCTGFAIRPILAGLWGDQRPAPGPSAMCDGQPC